MHTHRKLEYRLHTTARVRQGINTYPVQRRKGMIREARPGGEEGLVGQRGDIFQSNSGYAEAGRRMHSYRGERRRADDH